MYGGIILVINETLNHWHGVTLEMENTLRIIVTNTPEKIEQHKLDTIPAPAECKLCGLRKMMTLGQWMDYVDNCQRCKDRR